MSKHQFTYITTLLTMATLLFATAGHVWARSMLAIAPSLGTATSFAVLAGSTATNTGPTSLVGDLGVSPGSAITGFPPGVVTGGTTHANDAVALQAQIDVTAAYNNLAGQACDTDLTGQDLGGLTLTPGVYCFPSTVAQMTGALTLDAQGDPDAVFVFQTGSTLTTASNASVLLINGASGCNVFWQVGSSATIGTETTFVGSVLALASITLNTNASLVGRALARTGAVTMDSNTISTLCSLAPTPVNTPISATSTATPTDIATPNPLTPTPTNTPVLSTNTATPTIIATPNPLTPTATNTPLLSTSTATPTIIATPNPLTPTTTATPTDIATPNPLTPTTTNTPLLSTSTPTLISTLAPTATLTMTATPRVVIDQPTDLDPGSEPENILSTLYLPFIGK